MAKYKIRHVIMACRIRFFICLLLDLLFLGIYLFEQFVHSGDQLVVNARSQTLGSVSYSDVRL